MLNGTFELESGEPFHILYLLKKKGTLSHALHAAGSASLAECQFADLVLLSDRSGASSFTSGQVHRSAAPGTQQGVSERQLQPCMFQYKYRPC